MSVYCQGLPLEVPNEKPRKARKGLRGNNPGLEAWVELNHRPHGYRAGLSERELGSEVPTRLPFTNILLSISRIYEHPAHLRERFSRLNGHHNGHQLHQPSETSV